MRDVELSSLDLTGACEQSFVRTIIHSEMTSPTGASRILTLLLADEGSTKLTQGDPVQREFRKLRGDPHDANSGRHGIGAGDRERGHRTGDAIVTLVVAAIPAGVTGAGGVLPQKGDRAKKLARGDEM